MAGFEPERPKAKKADPLAKHRAAAERLWEIQERLRAEVIRGARQRPATDERLERIAERLEAGVTVEDCEHALRVRATEVKARPDAAKWFDGVSNWRKDNLEADIGRAAPAPAPVNTGRRRVMSADDPLLEGT